MAAATTAVPATSQAAVVWSGNTGFTPVTVPLGSTASIPFPTFGSVFRFSNYVRSVGPGSTSTSSPGPVVPYNSVVVHRLIGTASVVIGSASNGVGGVAFGNDAIRFAYSQSFVQVDGGEGAPHWSNAPTSNTGLDLAGDSAGMWNGPGTQTGYMLFRFDPDGGADSFRYGWFDLSYDNDKDVLTVNGWAYNDTGASLGAGHLGLTEVPEASALVPAGLFALAAGAAGIRRRRSALQKAAALAQK